MQPEVQLIYSDVGVLRCLYMSVSLIFQQGSPTSLDCFSSACTISIPSWKTKVVCHYELHTVKSKDVLSYADVLLSLARETNQNFNLVGSTNIRKTYKFQQNLTRHKVFIV